MQKMPLTYRLKHRVILQEATQSADGAGGFSTSWSDVDTVWAEIVPFASRSTTQERLVAEQLDVQQRYRITMRYRSGVDAGMRVKYGSRLFNILSVVNVQERGEALEIFCLEE